MKTLSVNSILKSGKLQYKIEKVLGQGSFGITYLASTTIKVEGPLGSIETPVKVAIKEFFMRDINGREEGTVTCSNQNGLYDRYKEKFIKEAQNLSKLKHRHIIKVLEVFEANNTYYYVMEFCEGGSLDDEIAAKGTLSEEETKRYAGQIADALDYMHDNKMLHLDLKPGNAMLRGDGDVVLIDFGLSKQYDENGQPESSTTIGGGTPGYAPLEQSNYDGKGFPKTMDIYALGGTMFKMLTGKRPPEASIILNYGFPTDELRQQGVSEQMICCIERSMSFRVVDRPQNIAEFLEILDGKGGARSQGQKDAGSQSADDEETIIDVNTDPNSDSDSDTDFDNRTQITPSAPKETAAPKTPETPKKKKSKAWIFILLTIILGGAGYLSWRVLDISANYTALMVQGDNLLNADQYEGARFRYESASGLEEDYALLCDIGILSGDSRDKLAMVQEKEQEAEQLAQAQKEAEAKAQAQKEAEAKAQAEKKRKAEQARLEKERQEREEAAKREEEQRKKEQSHLTCNELKYAGFRFFNENNSVKVVVKPNNYTSRIYKSSPYYLRDGDFVDNMSCYGGNVSANGVLNGVVVIDGNDSYNYLAYICDGKMAFPIIGVTYYEGGFLMSLEEGVYSYGCAHSSWNSYNDEGLCGSMRKVYQKDFFDQNVLREIYNATIDTYELEKALIEFVRSGKKLSDSWSADPEYSDKYEGFVLYSQIDEYYCDGVYDPHESRYENGHALHTPNLNINKDHFRVSFSFKAVKNDTEDYRWRGEQWVLVLSAGYRDLGVCLKNDGKIYVTTNNMGNYYETDLNYSINEYVDIDMEYKDGVLYMNGQHIDIDMRTPHDGQFHSVNYGTGSAFKGYIKDLRIYSY